MPALRAPLGTFTVVLPDAGWHRVGNERRRSHAVARWLRFAVKDFIWPDIFVVVVLPSKVPYE